MSVQKSNLPEREKRPGHAGTHRPYVRANCKDDRMIEAVETHRKMPFARSPLIDAAHDFTITFPGRARE